MAKFRVTNMYISDFTGDIIEADSKEEAFDELFRLIADDLGDYLELDFEEIEDEEEEN